MIWVRLPPSWRHSTTARMPASSRGAHLVLHQGLLQEERGARHLDARPDGADKVAVDARHVGQDLLVEQIEMLLLAADLADPLPSMLRMSLRLASLRSSAIRLTT